RGRCARDAVRGGLLRRRDRRLRGPQPRRPGRRLARAAARAETGRARRHPGDHTPARRPPAVLQALVRRARSLGRETAPGRLRVHLPAGERPPVPRGEGAFRADAGRGLRAGALPPLRGRHRRPAYGNSQVIQMSALTAIHETEGLDRYLDEIEQRLLEAVRRHPGLAATVGEEALAAGGKRLRPLLVFLAAPPEREPPWAVGVSVALVHMATLVHDDLIDRAGYRRGHASAWARYGPGAARAAGDYLFARAFAELAGTGNGQAVSTLASACLSLARGEALQRAQSHDPETTIDSYLERCALKTGKLFEAACLLGAGVTRANAPALAEFGLALGIAFQIADDILDCTGDALDTGKIAGTDLREGTPTLPLLLAAREDGVVRRALAGGSLDGALVR